MKREFIIHTGFHKTGSSSIQATLSQLDMAEHDYLDWGVANHSGPFEFAFGNYDHLAENHPYRLQPPEARERKRATFVAKLDEGIAASRKPRMIVSAEAISKKRNTSSARAFAEHLHPHADRFRVMSYIRPPAGLMTSTLQQRMKVGQNAQFPPRIRYKEKIASMRDVFGEDACEFRLFSPAALEDGDVVIDFARWCGVAIDASQVLRTNESISLEAMGAVLLYTRHGQHKQNYQGAAIVQHMLLARLAPLGKTKFSLSEDLVAQGKVRIRKDMRILADMFGAEALEEQPKGTVLGSEEDLADVGRAQVDGLRGIATALRNEGGGPGDAMDAALERAERAEGTDRRVAALVDAIKDKCKADRDAEIAQRAEARRAAARSQRERMTS